MNANSRSRVATNISEITTNNITENSSIKNGVVLSVEGLNNEAYESSTDNCENGHCLQFQMNKLNIDNETTDILKDTSDNPHYLQLRCLKQKQMMKLMKFQRIILKILITFNLTYPKQQ